MCGQEDFVGVESGGQQTVAGVASGCFERGAARALDFRGQNLQWDVQLASERAAVGGPLFGCGAQAVVDV